MIGLLRRRPPAPLTEREAHELATGEPMALRPDNGARVPLYGSLWAARRAYRAHRAELDRMAGPGRRPEGYWRHVAGRLTRDGIDWDAPGDEDRLETDRVRHLVSRRQLTDADVRAIIAAGEHPGATDGERRRAAIVRAAIPARDRR